MPLIKGGRFVTDPWRHLADDEAVPTDVPRVTISWARWLKERDALAALPAELGLRFPNDLAVAKIADDLCRFTLIVLNFPKFTDGRAYSQARLLRGRYRFAGELRADGEVLRDQLLFMRRVGFDAFAVSERAHFENWLHAFREIDVFYQPAEDRQISRLRRRILGAKGGGDFTVA
jgi:uncharacterized protein (DUF934 family)